MSLKFSKTCDSMFTSRFKFCNVWSFEVYTCWLNYLQFQGNSFVAFFLASVKSRLHMVDILFYSFYLHNFYQRNPAIENIFSVVTYFSMDIK